MATIEKNNLNFLAKVIFCFIFFYLGTIAYLIQFSKYNAWDFISKDIVSFYTGGIIVGEGKISDLYKINTQIETQNQLKKIYFPDEEFNSEVARSFRNVPMIAVLYSNLIRIGFLEAVLLNGIGVILLIFLVLFFLFDIEKNPFVFLFTLFALPIYINISEGQLAVLIVLALLFMYKLLKNNMFFLAGILTGLLLIKIQFIILIPLLLVGFKNRNLIVGAVVGMVFLLVINSFLYGSFFIPKYIKFIVETETYKYGTQISQNVNLIGLLGGYVPSFYMLGAFLMSFMYFFAFFILSSDSNLDLHVKYSAILIIGVSLLPHAMLSDLLVLLIPLSLLITRGMSKTFLLIGFVVVPYLAVFQLAYLVSVIYYIFGISLLLFSRKSPEHILFINNRVI